MKKSVILLFILLTSIPSAVLAFPREGKQQPTQATEGEVALKFRDNVTEDEVRDLLGDTLLRYRPLSRIAVISTTRGAEDTTLLSWRQHPLVERAERVLIQRIVPVEQHSFPETPNQIPHSQRLTQDCRRVPNDDHIIRGDHWNYEQMHLPEAWCLTTGSRNVIVADLDTGADSHHRDLSGKVISGYNFLDNNGDASEQHPEYHGSIVAGAIGAATDNSIDIASVGWNIRVMPLIVCDYLGDCYSDAVVEAIHYATQNGASVINMPFGGPDDSPLEAEAIEAAWRTGIVLTAATGNEGSAVANFPARHDHVLGFGSIGYYRERWGLSNKGADLMTGSVEIWHLWWFETTKGSGTSLSSAQGAGFVGLMIAYRPELSNSQIVQAMKETAEDLGPSGWDSEYGYGLLNAYSALRWGFPEPTPTTRPRPTNTPVPTPTRIPSPTPTPTPQPQLIVVPEEIPFLFELGEQGTKTQRLIIGGSSLDGTSWHVDTEERHWLNLDRYTGGIPDEIHVAVNPHDLGVGSYESVLTFYCTQANNGPIEVRVRVVVAEKIQTSYLPLLRN